MTIGTSRAGPVGAALALVLCVAGTPAVGRAQGAESRTANISGVVYDSILHRPIGGASIELVRANEPASKPYTALSDAEGRYSLPGVPYGRYLAGFFHAAMDTLGMEVTPREVEVNAPASRIDLATPSPRTIMGSICPREALGDSAGLLLGHVRSTETQLPIPGASVVVEWSSIVVTEEGLGGRSYRAGGVAGEPGGFAICGLPSDPTLQVRAFHGPDSSGFIEVRVPPQQLRHVSFFIGSGTSGAPVSSGNPAANIPADSVRRASAQLVGTVVDAGGRPVVGAHALVWDTQITTTTGERGTFVLNGLPGGTHTLEVRAIGYVPVTTTVQLSPVRSASAEVTLVRVADVLPTVTVRAELVYSRNLAEFDRRRRAGFGKYVTMADIERRPNAKLSQLLQGQQGIRVTSQNGETFVTMERPATQVSSGEAFREACSPSLFVDGVLDIANDFDAYYADRIVGIEIYREASRPFEFIDARNPCGVVAIWTRPPPSRRARPQ